MWDDQEKENWGKFNKQFNGNKNASLTFLTNWRIVQATGNEH
jgi:hypothetical protein